MIEFAYANIDRSMLWISVIQLVISFVGLFSIFLSLKSYRNEAKKSAEQENTNRELINGISKLVQYQFENTKQNLIAAKASNKPIFKNPNSPNFQVDNNESSAVFNFKNIGSLASNFEIENYVHEWEHILSTNGGFVDYSATFSVRLININSRKWPGDKYFKDRNMLAQNQEYHFKIKYTDMIGTNYEFIVKGIRNQMEIIGSYET